MIQRSQLIENFNCTICLNMVPTVMKGRVPDKCRDYRDGAATGRIRIATNHRLSARVRGRYLAPSVLTHWRCNSLPQMTWNGRTVWYLRSRGSAPNWSRVIPSILGVGRKLRRRHQNRLDRFLVTLSCVLRDYAQVVTKITNIDIVSRR